MAKQITIVGAGYSGCALAANLLRQAATPVAITLVEKRLPLAEGQAYSTPFPSHVLNVRAAQMSALADVPAHFVQWLTRNQATLPYGAGPFEPLFVQRRHFGAYVRETLEEATRGSTSSLSTLEGEVTDVTADGTVHLASGQTVAGDGTVLCLGHAAPVLPQALQAVRHHARVVENPWHWASIENLPRHGEVLIVGTGLTMVDTVLALDQCGFAGRITALSRHGLLPQVHPPQALPPGDDALGGATPTSTRAMVRTLRAAAQQHDWRVVVDSLRPRIPALWRGLPATEQCRFLRHLRAYWEVHRHRIAPEVHAALQRVQQAGRLRVLAGHVTDATATAEALHVTIRPRGHTQPQGHAFATAINCTGVLPRWTSHPLLRTLRTRGIAFPGPQNLGLAINDDGALLDAQGQASSRLYAIGPAWTGKDYESVAVPELRVQAMRVAQALLA